MHSYRSSTPSVALGLFATVVLAAPLVQAHDHDRTHVRHGAITPAGAYANVQPVQVVVPTDAQPRSQPATPGYVFADGCWYQSQVSGSVRDQGRVKHPDLTISASVHCGHGVTSNRPRALRGGALTEGALEAAASDAATVRTFHQGQLCVYRPVMDRLGATVRALRVERDCNAMPEARGGGPGSTGAGAVVSQRFTRDLENGCEYRAQLRGRTAEQGNAALRVRASVHCPERPATRAAERAVTAAPGEVLERLERAGTVRVEANGEACTYTPKFELSQGRPEGRSVSYVCRNERTGAVARGGVYIDRSPVPEEDPARREGDVLGEVSRDEAESAITGQ